MGYKCQKCNKVEELDVVHKHENSRKEIIKRVFENYKTTDENYEIDDVQKVVDEIHNAHLPIENAFLFLCRTCHLEYDSGTENWDYDSSVQRIIKSRKPKKNSQSNDPINPTSKKNINPKEIL